MMIKVFISKSHERKIWFFQVSKSKIENQRARQSGTFLSIEQQYLPSPDTTWTATATDETASKIFKIGTHEEKFDFSSIKIENTETTCSSRQRQSFRYLSNVLTGTSTNTILYRYPVPGTNCTYRTQYMYHVQSNPTTLIFKDPIKIFLIQSVEFLCNARPSVATTPSVRPLSPYKWKTK